MVPRNVRSEADQVSPRNSSSLYNWRDVQTALSSHVIHTSWPGTPTSRSARQSTPKTSNTTPYITKENAQEFTPTSTILVGPKHTPFHLHTHLLTQHSSYFRAALRGPFIESTTNTMTLSDISPSDFSLLVTHLYTARMPRPFKDGKPAYYALLHAYALADRLNLEAARNAAIDAISDLADSTNSVPTPEDTWFVYDEMRESALVRKLVVDLFVFKKTDRLVEGHPDEWHPRFLRDLVVGLKRPGEQAVRKHALRVWCPVEWREARACEACRGVVVPGQGAVRCEGCGGVFCNVCVGEGTAVAGWEEGRRRCGDGEVQGSPGKRARKEGKWEACKPWRGARCLLYHEHDETEKCVDVLG
ncbi:hypothetical protein COCMIDRAFT_83900 [Bipolaris oryzae ATCC 44560]|uniref:BTB domain-containing protein n=1 Tax=Bipolaris oryzae ATCC 44560 TaxID=930090 RepID=W6ZIB9_COCMI|nr:uncharacterized protein COCMIDRAFT_83900 [Bipolaris oryzae ATCC 44560]EUC49740.1 hypothetical protein COCMIDRAFT_83900 [Bipolaris oryzae ATCC 44560]